MSAHLMRMGMDRIIVDSGKINLAVRLHIDTFAISSSRHLDLGTWTFGVSEPVVMFQAVDIATPA
jgi:hypothetical protein